MESSSSSTRTASLRKLQVADELKRLIGCQHPIRQFVARTARKIDPQRPYVYPHLRSLLAPEHEGNSDSVVGELMKDRLEESIISFTASFGFRRSNSIIEYGSFRKVCLLLWSFTSTSGTDARRYEAMKELGGGWDIGTWRKALGPEWEVCLRLAQHLIEMNAIQEDDVSGDGDESAAA